MKHRHKWEYDRVSFHEHRDMGECVKYRVTRENTMEVCANPRHYDDEVTYWYCNCGGKKRVIVREAK